MVMSKLPMYPRPHVLDNSFNLSINVAGKDSTIYPLIIQDEGLGTPSGYSSNPQNAAFAEAATPNCYPDSRINSIMARFRIALTKGCVHTDLIEEMNIVVIPIFMSFKENYTAIDEVSSEEVQDSLEMQYESTDRQGYPLYNATDLTGDNLSLSNDVPGLTGGNTIEGITFLLDNLYNTLQYRTISGKTSASIGKIQILTIKRRQHKIYNLKIRLTDKVKRMNPFTFCGVLFHIPAQQLSQQIGNIADDSAIDHINIAVESRYLERNENFDHMRV